MSGRNKTGIEIAVLIVIIVGATIVGIAGIYSFTPGVNGTFQGPITGVNGVKDNCGSFYPLANPVSLCTSTYSVTGVLYKTSETWSFPSTSTTNPEIKLKWCGASIYLLTGCTYNDVPYSISSPQQICSTGSGVSLISQACIPVRYFTQNSSGFYDNNGEVVTYRFSIEVKVSQISSPQLILSGLSFINQIGFQKWLSAYDPVNNSWQGYASQYPLFLVISGCQEANQKSTLGQCGGVSGASNDVINPESQGSQVALYNNPQIQGGWNSLGCSINNECSNINATLSSNGSPTQQISPAPVYFPETLSSWGAYSCSGLKICYPDVTLTFTLYTLLIGSYLTGSTNPDQTKYVPTPPGPTCGTACQVLSFFNGIAQGLKNYSIELAFIVGGILIAVILSITIPLSMRKGRN